jgi:hypothetical protein
VVSDSRRGERTSRVSVGEDCNSVTVCLRPCLLFGCNRRFVAGGTIRASWCRSPGSPGWHLALSSGVVRPEQRRRPGSVFHECPYHRERTGRAFGHVHVPVHVPRVGDVSTCGAQSFSPQVSSSRVIGPSLTELTCMDARNTPVATGAPRRRSSATTSSTRGSATSAGAAPSQDGRRPLRVSA